GRPQPRAAARDGYGARRTGRRVLRRLRGTARSGYGAGKDEAEPAARSLATLRHAAKWLRRRPRTGPDRPPRSAATLRDGTKRVTPPVRRAAPRGRQRATPGRPCSLKRALHA